MIKFQYNKTSLQGLDKQLKMRVRALPTIKNKESALRSEVKKAKQVADEFNVKLEETLNSLNDMLQLCQNVGEKDCRSKDACSRRGGL